MIFLTYATTWPLFALAKWYNYSNELTEGVKGRIWTKDIEKKN
jgi:hypothetical protein